jgi:hypothetical protein
VPEEGETEPPQIYVGEGGGRSQHAATEEEGTGPCEQRWRMRGSGHRRIYAGGGGSQPPRAALEEEGAAGPHEQHRRRRALAPRATLEEEGARAVRRRTES